MTVPNSIYTGTVSQSINPMTRLSVTEQDRSIVNKASHPQYLSRYHGGHRRDNHPYASGYWYFIINPPERLFGDHNMGTNGTGAGYTSKTLEKARDWMHCTAEGFTPPNRTVTKADVPGMGGMASSYITGQEITQTFSVTFREYQELPIFNILQTWTSMLDPNTGVSPLAGDEYIPANYKGSAFVALCKPTIGTRITNSASGSTGFPSTHLKKEDIEQVFFFDGVWPESAPWDSLSSDIATNDVLQLSVSFSFDGFPLLKDSPGVVDEFISLMQDLNIGSTYEHYQQGIDKATTSDNRSNTGTGDLLGTNQNSNFAGIQSATGV